MSRPLQILINCGALVFWSALLLYFSFTDRITAFLHPMFRPYALAAGLVLALLAAAYAVAARRPADACCEEGGCGGGGEGGGVGHLFSLALLVGLPLGAAGLSSDTFSVSTVLNRGIVMNASALGAARERAPEDAPLPGSSGAPPSSDALPSDAPPGEPYGFAASKDARGRMQLEVIDLVFGTQDEGIRRDFEGKEVTIVGQVLLAREMNPDGDRMKLVRMFMVCCAADARPIAVLFRKPATWQAPDMTWVRVSGLATFPVLDGTRTVVIDPAEVEPCDPPDETMLF